jgi:large subunit ribosomal protein L31e
MSQELERVHTINLGKVLLSPNNQRAKRAINMVKEYASRHMKTQEIKIEESLSHQIWKRGIRHPPRKIRVMMTKTDEGFVLVSPYEEETESAKATPEKKPSEVKEKPKPETKKVETTEVTKEEPKDKEPKETISKPKEPKAKESKPKVKASKPKTKESKKESGKKAKPKKKSK